MDVKLWCCSNIDYRNKPYFDYTSLSYKRTDSIKKFLHGTTQPWRWFKRKGWACVKVEVKITVNA